MAQEPLPPTGELILYATEDGRARVECRFAGETVWLSQALMAELYQKDVRTINEHLQNLFEDGELDPEATIRKFRIVRQEGTREVARLIDHYNLDAILAIGYRVRSPRGIQFRRWATARLSEYLVKGFTMDDERLKNPPVEGSGVPDYFDELLERIRDIRASERRMYLRVKEIFAQAAGYQEPGTLLAPAPGLRPCGSSSWPLPYSTPARVPSSTKTLRTDFSGAMVLNPEPSAAELQRRSLFPIGRRSAILERPEPNTLLSGLMLSQSATAREGR
jgi:hypothetical protein